MRQISLLIKAVMEGMMVCLEHCRRLIDHLATALCVRLRVSVCVYSCVINVLTKGVCD